MFKCIGTYSYCYGGFDRLIDVLINVTADKWSEEKKAQEEN